MTSFIRWDNSSISHKIDLLKKYYQIPFTKDGQQISVFITLFGLYHYTVAPFEMGNCPTIFQRAMNNLTHGLDGVAVCIDDVAFIF